MRAAPFALLVLFGCHAQRASFAPTDDDTPAACEARKQSLLSLVAALPERSLGTDFHVELPASTLGTLPGAGPVLEVSESSQALDGEALDRAAWASRAKLLPAASTLYVAAAPDVTIDALRAALVPVPRNVALKLLVRVRSPAALPADAGTPERARAIATQVLTEDDPAVRRRVAEQGYAEFSRCPTLAGAVASAARAKPNGRWPALHAALGAALPACPCDSFSAGALRALVTAEQRAGTATLGALPLDFIRDQRCEASMGLRSVQRLLGQMERFDEDYAGKITDDAVRFEQVITSDRLLVEFCDALPGETLAALERKRATIYWRIPGSSECEGWTFAPLAPGAPMGTWRRAAHGSIPAAAFHYWQAAEEISVYGPVATDPPSKPTDQRDWACKTNYKLLGIDGDSIQLENGRWFFDDASCRSASESSAMSFCSEPAGG